MLRRSAPIRGRLQRGAVVGFVGLALGVPLASAAASDLTAATGYQRSLPEPPGRGAPLSHPSATSPRTALAVDGDDPVVAAAGDISCYPYAPPQPGQCRQARTADAVVAMAPDKVLALGDLQYDDATYDEFLDGYDKSWGRFKDRTRPAIGNHEYQTPGARGYFDYFGAAAGDRAKGYYSFDLGQWHLVALNSECAQILGGCAAGSPQERWLRADLAAHPNRCTLAYWHKPLFSSSSVPVEPAVRPLWKALQDTGTELVLTGHAHSYERFAPQTASGVADPAYGITQFVVGTGGRSFHDMAARQPNSVARNDTDYGVLRLTLHPDSYDFAFVAVDGGTFVDSGRVNCHGVRDTVAPSAPSSLSATATDGGRVDLSWSASPDTDVAKYNVYRGIGSGTRTLLTTVTGGTRYADTAVTPRTTYTYQVEAVDVVGHVSKTRSPVARVTTPASSTKSYTFTAVADAMISAASPGSNYGKTTSLSVDASPVQHSLLKFTVKTSGCRTISSARLTLSVNANGSASGGAVDTTANSWTETGVTWRNAPAAGATVGRFGGIDPGGTYSTDVTAGVRVLNGSLSLRMDTASTDAAQYWSREGAPETDPRLVVTCSS